MQRRKQVVAAKRRVEALEASLRARAMEAADAVSPMVSVDSSYARKLLRDLAAWSQSIGFAPHRDFSTVEQIFGDVSADVSDAVFRFGRGGRPLYIPRPNDTVDLVLRRAGHLQKYFFGREGSGLETAA